MEEWGTMSFITDGSNHLMRRPNKLWVLEDKSDKKLSQNTVDFPPMVVNVFDNIVLRGAFSEGVRSIEIVENFGGPPDPKNLIFISVKHIGENIKNSDSNLETLKNMVLKFPPSYYEIEINNADASRIYKQVFTEKSGKLHHGEITTNISEDTMSWTKVTFKPDLQIFNISYEYDGLNIGRTIWKRCVDIAGTLRHLTVTLAGLDLNMKNFAQFIDRWYPQFVIEKRLDDPDPKRIHETLTKGNHKWEVSIGRSHGQFEHISFVNGLPTHGGGPHVELVKTALTNYVVEVEKKTQKSDCHHIEFLYQLEFSLDFVNKIAEILKELGPAKLNKKIPTLVDATQAGGEMSNQCCLILTEGESAKKFALIGHGFLDRQFYGLLPIRGKIPNAKRNDSNVLDHDEVKNIMTSLGLVKGACYSSAKKLRYGQLMLMMDQDHDGSHIKGLVINLIHTFWPSLLKINFLSQFVTPVIKVKTNSDFNEFYSIPAYDIWAKTHHNDLGSVDCTIRYFKGLASHDPKDVIDYMSKKQHHVKTFEFSGPQDFNAINLAFSENRVYDRRQWIMTFEEGTFLDLSHESITYSDFFNKEFILYSIEDIKRSIPSMIDGLKPSQRKALFTARKMNLDIKKVDSLAGAVCNECEYHHGQGSMSDTIVGMAQNYVGTNNINLFAPKGIFGSRREGTKTGARYLSVMVSEMTRYIFPKEDDALLSYLVEDEKSVQPDWFLPVIPMALVNGCEGIATGWNTKITKYSPLVIINNLMSLLKGENSEYEELIPWFKGFMGGVDKGFEGSYTVSGVIINDKPPTVQILELPVDTKIDKCKDDLDSLKTNGKIESYEEQHEGDNIKFVVAFTEDQFEAAKKQGFHQFFKLVGTITTDNMHLIDEKGSLTKYSSADEVLHSFYVFRLPFYEKRKIRLAEQCEEEVKKLKNLRKYIVDYNNDKFSKKPSERMRQFQEFGYDSFDNFKDLRQLSLDDLDMDRIDGIERKCKSIQEALKTLKGKTAIDLWLDDLIALKQKLTITEDPEVSPHKKQRTGP